MCWKINFYCIVFSLLIALDIYAGLLFGSSTLFLSLACLLPRVLIIVLSVLSGSDSHNYHPPVPVGGVSEVISDCQPSSQAKVWFSFNIVQNVSFDQPLWHLW